MHFCYVFLRTSSVLFILCAFILLCFTSSHVLLDKMQITLWHRKLAQKCWRAASVVSRKEMSFCRSPNARRFANRQVTTKSRSLCTSTLCIVYPVPLFFFPVIIVIYFIYIYVYVYILICIMKLYSQKQCLVFARVATDALTTLSFWV